MDWGDLHTIGMILLTILKIIGIGILVILAALLLILLLLLFVPVRYRSTGEISKDDRRAMAKVSYLASAVSAVVSFRDGKASWEVKLFGIQILPKNMADSSDKKSVLHSKQRETAPDGPSENTHSAEKVHPQKSKEEENHNTEISGKADSSGGEAVTIRSRDIPDKNGTGKMKFAESESDEKDLTKNSKGGNKSGRNGSDENKYEKYESNTNDIGENKYEKYDYDKNDISENKFKKNEHDRDETNENKFASGGADINETQENKSDENGELSGIERLYRRISNLFAGIRERFQQIPERIAGFRTRWKEISRKADHWKNFYHMDETQVTLEVLKAETGKLIRYLMPTRIRANIHFGFADPADTGVVLGAISALYGFFPKGIDLEPDFEEQVLEGEWKLKGRIRLAYFVRLALRLLLKRENRITYQRLRKLMKEQ